MHSNLKLKIDKIINSFTDLLFPKSCLSCGREGSFVCPECFAKIPIQTSFHCHICGQRSPSGKACPECKKSSDSGLNGLLIASDWQNLLVRQLIYECKYRFIAELTQPLALILAKFMTINGIAPWPSQYQTKFLNPALSDLSRVKLREVGGWQTDELILIPVPLHKRRENWRGFNQAKKICEYLAKQLNIEMADNLIYRDRHTPPQMDIKDKKERTLNVSGAFKLNNKIKKNLKGKIIILIDDVCTTGATLNDCAGALKESKPKEIWGLAIARG